MSVHTNYTCTPQKNKSEGGGEKGGLFLRAFFFLSNTFCCSVRVDVDPVQQNDDEEATQKSSAELVPCQKDSMQ